jgi:hypothetical protein
MAEGHQANQTKERPMTNEQKRSQRDQLILTTEEGKIELTEQELKRITGGSVNQQSGVYWKYDAFLKY